ncbi:hypothetical protein [Photobacterium leiognathi]|uniref:hypothetical protein n=1 Tax=Photobacterium leiognathi TaxID=553611 RepID=UPI00076A4E4B|nr:hypothetical protein [Photobacterium leiognathi]
MHYDVFNGDADGIIALLQLRLAHPKESQLISGVKRDIKLLDRVVKNDNASSVTVLDISMEKNQSALTSLLTQDTKVFYCDHHRTGDIPQSEHLTTLIDLDSEVCTSLLINKHLNGQYVLWAIAAAFGDNLMATAEAIAKQNNVSDQDIEFLKELGTLINYNGYGSSLDDLHIEPTVLFRQLLEYPNPLMLRDAPLSPYFALKQCYEQDCAHLNTLDPIHSDDVSRVFELPCDAWARRVSGVFGNALANQAPSLAHAVLTLNPNLNDYTVSVRAPLANRIGADDICSLFATGGGRKAAAGINALPVNEKRNFIEAITQYYS